MKRIKYFNTLFVLLSLLFFSTCKKENRCDCFKRTGAIETEIRNVGPFNKIYVENNLNVFIIQDSVCQVKVEAGEHLIPLIKTEITDGTLFIKNKNKCNWARSYDKPFNVYVRMPYVKYITSNGTGDIKSSNTITTDTFEIQTKNSGNIELTVNSSRITSHLFGSGDLTLHGKTYEHACSIGGTGYLYSADLQTNYTWIESYTTGLCYIAASDLLICRIDQIGDVYCYTRPATIEKTFFGAGHLYLP